MIQTPSASRAVRLLVVFAFLAAVSAGQNVLNVPGGFPSIQAAINAASPGDTVQVGGGMYFERIDFLGKDIAIVGAGALKTTIHGGGLTLGSTVTFSGGETRAARLTGFTVTAGSGTHFMVGGFEKLIGGGIMCSGASPTLEDCIVRNNILPASVGAFLMVGGGGIAVTGSGAHPLIRRLQIRDNIVNIPTTGLVNLEVMGGGVLVESGAIGEIEDCVIRDNEVTTAPGLGDGGGVGATAPIGLTRCTVSGNVAGNGGGILSLDVTLLENCRILQNMATAGCGGGLALGDALGQATHQVRGCIVAQNSAAMTGGGIFASEVTLDHTTVTANTAPSDGGLHLPLGVAFIARSIVWGNTPGTFCSSTVAIVDSNVEGATAKGCSGPMSINVMDTDPMFLDPAAGNFGIDPGSPIRDVVQSSSPTLTTDIDGDPRMFCPLPDMGADEFYGFDDIAESAVGAGMGGPFDVLTINGSAGGIDRRVVLELPQSFTIDVLQPPTNPQPASFIIFGFLGVPDPGMTQELPLGFGTVAIPVELITPGVPGVFTLTSSFGPIPTQLTASTPTPWATGGMGPPIPMKISLQGLIEESPGVPVVTNGIIMDYRQ